MIIFRWLYDEMHFNWLKDAKKMFLAYEPCGAWTYRVDPKCKKQRDGHQCGVWTLANASCLMIGINMDILTEAVIERLRKLIFSRLCSFKNLKIGGQPKLRPAAPWYRGPHHKLRLPALKAVLSLDTRSTAFARPSVRIQPCGMPRSFSTSGGIGGFFLPVSTHVGLSGRSITCLFHVGRGRTHSPVVARTCVCYADAL
jgi:hypothetical protein